VGPLAYCVAGSEKAREGGGSGPRGVCRRNCPTPVLSETRGRYTLFYQRENPRLCQGGSRSLTFTEVVPGLILYVLLAEFFERRGAWAPSLRDSGQIVGFAHPALKRGASKHCAYGAGAKAGAGNELPLARSWRWQCASDVKKVALAVRFPWQEGGAGSALPLSRRLARPL